MLFLVLIWTAFSGFQLLYEDYNHLNFVQISFGVIAPILFSACITLYFLIPSVKTTYFDPRIRWWESKPRFLVDIIAKALKENNHNLDLVINNISEGGISFQSSQDFEIDEVVKVKFEINGQPFDVSLEIVFKRSDVSYFGAKFITTDSLFKKEIKKAIKFIQQNGAELSRSIPMWDDDLKEWFKNLIRTGKGIVPKVPQKYIVKK